jgi:hypothetical protein
LSFVFFVVLCNTASTAGNYVLHFLIPYFENITITALVFFIVLIALIVVIWFNFFATFRPYFIAGAFFLSALVLTLLYANFTFYNGTRYEGYLDLFYAKCAIYPESCDEQALIREYYYQVSVYGLFCSSSNYDCHLSHYVSLRVLNALVSIAVVSPLWIIAQGFFLYCLVKGATWQSERTRWLALTGQG